MTPVTINLYPHQEGDSWLGIATIGPVLVNGVQPLHQLARIKMKFRRGSEHGPLLAAFDSDAGAIAAGALPITIDDPVTWQASIDQVDVADFPALEGSYYWDMKFTDTEGITLTFFAGVLTVTASPTGQP